MRPLARVSAAVWRVQNLFPRLGAERDDSRSAQGELVKARAQGLGVCAGGQYHFHSCTSFTDTAGEESVIRCR
jgi:hypothetical protein